MTFIYEYDLYPQMMYLHTHNKLSRSRLSKVRKKGRGHVFSLAKASTYRKFIVGMPVLYIIGEYTDRQTDSTECIIYMM